MTEEEVIIRDLCKELGWSDSKEAPVLELVKRLVRVIRERQAEWFLPNTPPFKI